jgi:hypothetical protein
VHTRRQALRKIRRIIDDGLTYDAPTLLTALTQAGLLGEITSDEPPKPRQRTTYAVLELLDRESYPGVIVPQTSDAYSITAGGSVWSRYRRVRGVDGRTRVTGDEWLSTWDGRQSSRIRIRLDDGEKHLFHVSRLVAAAFGGESLH